ncbi:hypothetical protein SDRG_06120 [Saprolegnia diclina VS20]|uniref:Uncharacterized protein n=1 Tax=Saprolegnia diclina (strain VS20) TaxID=1156394 RepID=T0QRT3_SAPDV|nr:hypothetical protein SDRG_06120 [Saprolegnia diclina VS20]EQC36685.1 hypothetical protein SDRG_06120 [Saprolegnia diclina VS20]|eukprot:XP_008610106.1 hypothetical protein SDRG_06120 [Saprolegnia diclina VS20]
MLLLCAVDCCTRFAKDGTCCLIHSRARSPASTSPPSHMTRLTKKITHVSRACKEPGCYSYARRLGRCSRHGGVNACDVDGCLTPAQSRGRCRMHGGGTLCKTTGCDAFARFKGHCSKHTQQRRTRSTAAA